MVSNIVITIVMGLVRRTATAKTETRTTTFLSCNQNQKHRPSNRRFYLAMSWDCLEWDTRDLPDFPANTPLLIRDQSVITTSEKASGSETCRFTSGSIKRLETHGREYNRADAQTDRRKTSFAFRSKHVI